VRQLARATRDRARGAPRRPASGGAVSTGLRCSTPRSRPAARGSGARSGKVYVVDAESSSMSDARLLPQIAHAASKTNVCVAIVRDAMRACGAFGMLEPVYVRNETVRARVSPRGASTAGS